MEETAKITDEEAVNNQDQQGAELQKDAIYPSLFYERIKKEERLKLPTYFETDEDFNAAWDAIIGDNPSLIASLSHRKDEFLCSWRKRNVYFREDLLERELELRIPTYSKSDEDFDVAWEAILVDNPSLIAPFSHSKDEFLCKWKQSNEILHGEMLTEELELRTPTYSESDEDFNAAWEAILVDNPSLIASLSHCKDKFLRSWKARNSYKVLGFSTTQACLADGYIHTLVGRVLNEGSESGSTTQSVQTVVYTSLPKNCSPSTNDNSNSKSLTTTKNSVVAAAPTSQRLWQTVVGLMAKTKRKR